MLNFFCSANLELAVMISRFSTETFYNPCSMPCPKHFGLISGNGSADTVKSLKVSRYHAAEEQVGCFSYPLNSEFMDCALLRPWKCRQKGDK
jgi:hypothetical protein